MYYINTTAKYAEVVRPGGAETFEKTRLAWGYSENALYIVTPSGIVNIYDADGLTINGTAAPGGAAARYAAISAALKV